MRGYIVVTWKFPSDMQKREGQSVSIEQSLTLGRLCLQQLCWPSPDLI